MSLLHRLAPYTCFLALFVGVNAGAWDRWGLERIG